MFFLLRVTFWLCIVLMLLPTGGSQSDVGGSQVSAVEAVSAASATVSDMRRFCERQPDACDVGAQTAAALGHRAQAGAKLLYEFLSEQLAEPAPTFAAPETTATISASAVPLPRARPGTSGQARQPQPTQSWIPRSSGVLPHSTLTSDDLAAPWRGPTPVREARMGGA